MMFVEFKERSEEYMNITTCKINLNSLFVKVIKGRSCTCNVTTNECYRYPFYTRLTSFELFKAKNILTWAY